MIGFGLTKEQIERIERDFAAVPVIDRISRLDEVMKICSHEERLYLQFIYAYMPATDISSYNCDFFLKAVRDTIKIRSLVSWGNGISDEMFLNYVLPVRINNEDLVDHREQFFNELYPRVKDLSIKDAAIEVNYWCLEKATYKSTNVRTSSPLTVVRNAFGRCGEESVLCVAAMRSVGIPARQCYTPRWAHCDDNHAWVEVWTGDGWHCIGACEPEPVVDKGWFTEPAQRAMLIHSRVFSQLVSEEHVISRSPVMSEANVLKNYAKTKTLRVVVTDDAGEPVEGAEVRFELINFAQLFPLIVLKTDARGEAGILTGFGDLYIHVSKDGRFMHKKADSLCEELNFSMAEAKTEDEGTFTLDMHPPVKGSEADPEISSEAAKRHEERVAQANELRHTFESSFIWGDAAEKYAASFAEFNGEISGLIALSNGNHAEIARFLETEYGIPLKYKILLLKSLKDKDLSDSNCEVLASHLNGAIWYKDTVKESLFTNYVLCPRVYLEKITDYRGFISGYFNDEQKAVFIKEPKEIHRYVEESIDDCGNHEYSTIFSFPQGLLEKKYGSEMSRKILFVAICRTLGIPARLSEIDLKAEYWKDNSWNTIGKGGDKSVERRCSLILKKKAADIPLAYETNFTVARLEDGVYHTLGLSDIPLDGDSVKYLLIEGKYRITVANRMRDGSILASLTHVELEANEERELILELREQELSESGYAMLPQISVKTLEGRQSTAQDLLGTAKNCVVAFIEEGKEPTEHLLNEIIEQKEKFSDECERMLLIAREEKSLNNALLKSVLKATGIPVVLRNEDDNIFDEVLTALNTDNRKLPLVMGLNADGHCVFHVSGYNVGTGAMLLKYFQN